MDSSAANPYASPEADLEQDQEITPINPGNFNIEACFNQAWKACWANFPLWIGVFLVGLILMILSGMTVIGYFIAAPVLGWGLVAFVLNMLKGQADFNDLFCGFKTYGKALGRCLLLGLLYIISALAFQSVSFIGIAVNEPALVQIGGWINIICSLILIRFYFAFFLMIDKDMTVMDAIKQSWVLTKGKFWKLVLLSLACACVVLVGAIALIIGIFPAAIITYLMWGSAYRQLVGDV